MVEGKPRQAPADPNTMKEQEVCGENLAHAAHHNESAKDSSRGRKDGAGDRKSELPELKSEPPELSRDPEENRKQIEAEK